MIKIGGWNDKSWRIDLKIDGSNEINCGWYDKNWLLETVG